MLKIENILIALFGIVTVITFHVMVVIGGLFDSVHQLVFHEVSYIISPYSPQKDITIPLFALYNVCLILFSLFMYVRCKNAMLKMAALYLILSAIFGLVLLDNPMDPQGISGSVQGIRHIFITLCMTLYLTIALFLFARGFYHLKHLHWLIHITYGVIVLLILAGSVTAVTALLSLRSYVGLTEKLPIIAFLMWIVLTSVGVLKSDNRITYVHSHQKKSKRR